jgi:Mn-dependent DtxR family transcriptional regulator
MGGDVTRPYQGLRVRKRTPRQRELVRTVLELTAELGRPPSARDVAKRLGVARQTALESLKLLERIGAVADLPRVVRSGTWQVTRDGQALADDETKQ